MNPAQIRALISALDVTNINTVNPPHDIIKLGDNSGFLIRIAVAGYTKDRIKVSETNYTLTIDFKASPEDENVDWVRSGIRNKDFSMSFNKPSRDLKLKQPVQLLDGILTIELENSDHRREIEVI